MYANVRECLKFYNLNTSLSYSSLHIHTSEKTEAWRNVKNLDLRGCYGHAGDSKVDLLLPLPCFDLPGLSREIQKRDNSRYCEQVPAINHTRNLQRRQAATSCVRRKLYPTQLFFHCLQTLLWKLTLFYPEQDRCLRSLTQGSFWLVSACVLLVVKYFYINLCKKSPQRNDLPSTRSQI